LWFHLDLLFLQQELTLNRIDFWIMAAVDVSRLETELKELQKKRGDVEYRLRSIENKEKAQQGLLGKRGRADNTHQQQAKRFREVRSDNRAEGSRREEGRPREEPPRSYRGDRDREQDTRPSRLSSIVTGQRAISRDSQANRREEPKKPKLTSAIVNSNPIPVVGEKPRPSLDTSSEETKKRSRNMFGMLVGTLKSFKTEINQKSEAEQRREELEQKVQQKVKEDQETFKEEQRRLLNEQKEKELALREEIRLQQEQKELELLNLKWDSHRSLLSAYIKTTAQPSLYWKPAKADQETDSKASEKRNSEARTKEEKSESQQEEEDKNEDK